MNAFLLTIQEATQPNNDGVFTDNEFLWVLGVALILIIVVAVAISVSRGD